jgi:tetratricopeptide (TPR) repeat protein
MTASHNEQVFQEEQRLRASALEFKSRASQSTQPLEKANYLIEEADCYRQLGEFEAAMACAISAKETVRGDALSSAQTDYYAATILIAQGQSEKGLQALSLVLEEYPNVFQGEEGQQLYEEIQLQRGITLKESGDYQNARPLLEEALSFRLSADTSATVRYHLGSAYFDLHLYGLAKNQFGALATLGVRDEWAAGYHYNFGFALYELKEFRGAKRELLLCLQNEGGPPTAYKYKLISAICRKLGESKEARLYAEKAQSTE